VSGGKSERYTKGKFSAMGVRGLGTIKCAVWEFLIQKWMR
jgi:hypothetical protein